MVFGTLLIMYSERKGFVDFGRAQGRRCESYVVDLAGKLFKENNVIPE